MSFTPVTLVRTYRVGQDPAQGWVSAQPAVRMVNGVTELEAPTTAMLDDTGTVVLPFVAYDDPGTTPAGVACVVTEQLRGAPLRTYSVFVSRTAGTLVGGVRVVDLSTLDVLTAPPPLVAPISRIRNAADYDDATAPEVGQTLVWTGAAYAPSFGEAASIVLARLAGPTALSGHCLVMPTGASGVDYASATDSAVAGAALWMTLSAAAAGTAVDVLTVGPVVESSWSWTPGRLYLGSGGQITQVVPSAANGAAVFVVVGHALSATAVMFDPQPPIRLS